MTAPLLSSTSLPQLSQTSTVLRATNSPPSTNNGVDTTPRGGRGEFGTNEGARASPAPPRPARYRERSRHANGVVGNRRSFCRRDTARQRRARRTRRDRRQVYFR